MLGWSCARLDADGAFAMVLMALFFGELCVLLLVLLLLCALDVAAGLVAFACLGLGAVICDAEVVAGAGWVEVAAYVEVAG